MFQAEYDNFTLCAKKCVQKKNELECSLNLSLDYFDKILSISAKIVETTASIDAGLLIYGGTVVFNAIFQNEELERNEVGAKFSFSMPIEKPSANESVKYQIDNVKIKKEGGMLFAVLEITATICYEEREDKKYLTSSNCLCNKAKNTSLCDIEFSNVFDIEDEFDAKRIKKVLWQDARASITMAEVKENCVICDGEVTLCVCLLPFLENSDILKEERIIPFRFEVDVQGAESFMQARASASVEKLQLKVIVDEENNKSTINTEIAVKIFGFVQGEVEEDFIIDVFSPTVELKPSFVERSIDKLVSQNSFIHKISGKAICDVPEYSRFIKLICESIEYTSSKEKDEILLVGVLNADALFSSGENELICKKASLPFSLSLKTDGEDLELEAVLQSVSAKLRSGAIEVDLTLRVCEVKTKKLVYKLVNDVIEGELTPENDSAISVYIAQKGDDEWTVMKRLQVGLEEIYKFNKDLEFPLKGDERIIVFRQK